ncbi:GerMN domain-containing protein [Ancylothrix sp. C2]|uniref:GerMN domain-containing protein n=1 Tax=Ancylothrix sp. D3o TaxID=2953691 RepID=UPI0021BBA7B7|nr:GerMN domain-containing protein [Ancylothrix sp. D3o]MCT7952811.1 GerMN domain-containing protein [Ancylothrix sp. D3o]
MKAKKILITGLLLISVAGCVPETQQPPAPTPTTPATTEPLKASPTPVAKPTPSEKMVSVMVYKADSDCQSLVPEKVEVPAKSSMEAAAGKVVERYDTGDFDVAGYRVSVDAKTGVATIDFRLAPNSKRRFVSLSSCEQFALFGSLKKTLTSNPAWKIKEVRFTERGKPIEI